MSFVVMVGGDVLRGIIFLARVWWGSRLREELVAREEGSALM